MRTSSFSCVDMIKNVVLEIFLMI